MAGFNTNVSRTTSGVSGMSRLAVRRLFEEAKRLYAPGGGYMKGTDLSLARGQKRAVATGMQNLAASGMAGTSLAGNIGQMYEEDIAQPALAAANTQRLSALAGLLQGQAGAEANLATRYSRTTSTTPYRDSNIRRAVGYGPAVSSGRRTSAPAPTASTRLAQKKFKFPSIFKPQPTGYKGVYFGKAFYDKQKGAAPKSGTTGSFYSDYLGKGGTPTGLKGLNPYNI